MSSKVRIELGQQFYTGMGNILKSAAMQHYVASEAAKKAAQMTASGTDYAVSVHNSGQRHIANIYPVRRKRKQ